MSDLADRVRTMVHAFDRGDDRRDVVRTIAAEVAALEAEVERLTARVALLEHDAEWQYATEGPLTTEEYEVFQREHDRLSAVYERIRHRAALAGEGGGA